VNSNGDLTVDLRSNIAAESRAKIVYEYLLQFTSDPYVRESLQFLMTREIAHFQQFSAALETIQPNFPPGVLQGEPRFANVYYNMSNGASSRGPWNSGQAPSSKLGQWVYVEDPIAQVRNTRGQLDFENETAPVSEEAARDMGEELARQRSGEVKEQVPSGENQWSAYPQEELASPGVVDKRR